MLFQPLLFLCFSLYTFDARNMKVPINVHMDHVGAVIDVDYSPTGKEFVSGSYDKTIRIYESHKVNCVHFLALQILL